MRPPLEVFALVPFDPSLSFIADPHLTRLGLPREYVQRRANRGALVRVARGLYADPDAPMSAQRSVAEVARAVPKGIVCLLSALKFHRLTTQAPPEGWIALGVHA